VTDSIRSRTGHSVGCGAGIPAEVDLADGVTEEEAVALVLWTSPSFQVALTKLGLARADVERAGFFGNPVLSLLFPWGDKQLEFAAKLPLDALWLRPQRIAAAEANHEQIATLLVRDGVDLVRDVRQSWARLRGARRTAAVLREMARNRERAAAAFAVLVEHGDASVADGLTSRAMALQAALEAERAEDAAELAEQPLLELIVVQDGSPVRLDTEPMRPYPELAALETLVAEALAGRPEVRAGELALEAAAARADLHRRDVLQLTAILDANALEGGGLDVGPGVEVELPVFGRRSGSELTRAEIEAQRAAWQMVETRRRIGREVREARLSYERAYAALGRLRSEVLPVLEEAQRTAERAAELGATSGLVPVEAEALWLAAQRTEVTLETELELARGELERSVGRRLDCASP
jgi:cobalt-zinc-cadmium efflux system outer membrane protein